MSSSHFGAIAMEYSLMASFRPSIPYGVFILVEPADLVDLISPAGLKLAGQDFSNSLKIVVFCQNKRKIKYLHQCKIIKG